MTPQNELLTVRDHLRYAVSRFNAANIFFGHGTNNAWDEAIYLTWHTLSLPLDQVDAFLDARLLPSEQAALQSIYERRCQERLPAAYLTNQAWLRGHAFYVDERVIVPRSFIAALLEDGLSPWVSDATAINNVLDLCTGSGCLAIFSASVFPAAMIDAVDISTEALDVARQNIENYGLESRITCVHSDAFAALQNSTYDVILCNPPYVTEKSMESLPPEYRHEPEIALESGKDGLDFVRILLREAKNHLNADGILVVEIGHNRPALENAFPETPFVWLDTEGFDDAVFLVHRADLS